MTKRATPNPLFSTSHKPFRSPHVLWAYLENSLVVFDLIDGAFAMVEGGDVANDIWRLCNGKRTLGEVVNQLFLKYDAPRSKIRDDVSRIVSVMVRRNMLLLSPRKLYSTWNPATAYLYDPKVLKLISDLKRKKNVLSIFVRGSIKESRSSSMSDLDLGVVTENGKPVIQEVVSNNIHKNVHIIYYPINAIEKAIRSPTGSLVGVDDVRSTIDLLHPVSTVHAVRAILYVHAVL